MHLSGIEHRSVARRRLILTKAVIAFAAMSWGVAAVASDECTIGREQASSATFAVRLFGGVIRIPVDYTLYGDEALSPGDQRRRLEFHVLSQSAPGEHRPSLSIASVADAGGIFERLPVLCTVGRLTVRQEMRQTIAATVIHDDNNYVIMLTTDANAWKDLLRDFVKGK